MGDSAALCINAQPVGAALSVQPDSIEAHSDHAKRT
jgi:hypothetical protein